MKIEKSTLLLRLDEANLKYDTVGLQDGFECVVTERGGRIFGPFSPQNPYGIFWIPEIYADEGRFADFLRRNLWNMGGDRIWIAPELQFSVKDRERFWQTLHTPEQIDPGHYRLTKENGSVALRQKISLQANILAIGTIDLDLERRIGKAENPLRELGGYQELMRGVAYCGFEQQVRLRGDGDPTVCAEAWSLGQVYPAGCLYIPASPRVEYADYYDPVARNQTIGGGCVKLNITGRTRYKVGYKSAQVYGRIAYATVQNDLPCLVVRNFPNNPSSRYGEEPPLQPKNRGFSIHVYNDDGSSGGFAEIECNAQTVGTPAGYRDSCDRVTTWIFYGSRSSLNEIAANLIGLDDLQYDLNKKSQEAQQ